MNTKDFASFKHVDTALIDGQHLKEVVVKSPSSQSWSVTKGGPLFISVGQTVQIETEQGLQIQVNDQNEKAETDQLSDGGRRLSASNSTTNSTTTKQAKIAKTSYATQYMFTNSPVEFY